MATCGRAGKVPVGPGMAVHMQPPLKWLLGCPHTGVPDIRVTVQAVVFYLLSIAAPASAA